MLVQREKHRYETAMAIYTVHIPPQGREEKARFIREGLNIFALILPFIWLLWHRLWLALLVYIAYGLALSVLTRMGAGMIAIVLSFLPALFLFIEGNQLVRNRLYRAGWQFSGVVIAANAREAEICYFTGNRHSESQMAAPASSAPVAHRPAHQPSFGMFPE
jgi:hypothetical protein